MKSPRRLGLLALWIAVLLALPELAGYTAFKVLGLKPLGSYGYPNGLYAPHPELGYLYTPNFSGTFSGTAFAEVRLQINSYGFRDRPFGTKNPTRKRLIVLGDSVVFGSGVSVGQRFTEMLAQAALPGTAPEVLNLGVNKYTFGHYLTIARLDFMGLDPEAVLVGFTLNDIANKVDPGPEWDIASTPQATTPGWRTRFNDWRRHTYTDKLWQELRNYAKTAAMSQAEKEEYYTKWMRSVVRYWQQERPRQRLAQELAAFKELMTARGTPYGFLLFPELNDLMYPGRFSLPRESAIGMFRELEIPYCEIHPFFGRSQDLRSLFLPGDSVHFTEAGHRLVAEAVADCISQGKISLDAPVPSRRH